jgi:hypothetical protein
VSRAFIALSVLSVACGSGIDAEAQQSAGRVSRAIEVVRNAPNAGKGEALVALAKTPCKGLDVCETRDACQAAYALYVEATTLTAAAKQQLASGNSLDAAKLLGSSETKLSAASAQVTTCVEREGAMRRRYKL